MPKIPDCGHCQFYSHDPHLVCAVHPQGVNPELLALSMAEGSRSEGNCLDFREDPNSPVSEDEQWSPQGYYWWDGELYLMFTYQCLKCGHEFDRNNLPRQTIFLSSFNKLARRL